MLKLVLSDEGEREKERETVGEAADRGGGEGPPPSLGESLAPTLARTRVTTIEEPRNIESSFALPLRVSFSSYTLLSLKYICIHLSIEVNLENCQIPRIF